MRVSTLKKVTRRRKWRYPFFEFLVVLPFHLLPRSRTLFLPEASARRRWQQRSFKHRWECQAEPISGIRMLKLLAIRSKSMTENVESFTNFSFLRYDPIDALTLTLPCSLHCFNKHTSIQFSTLIVIFVKCRTNIYCILLSPRILHFHLPAGMVFTLNLLLPIRNQVFPSYLLEA